MNTSVQVTETAAQTAQAAAAQLGVIPEDVRGRLEGASPVTLAAFEKLKAYMAAMAPKKPITIEEGARWQVQLYSLLTTIINKVPNEDFEGAFTVLLRTFDANKADTAVFHEKYVFRFMDMVPLTNENDRRALLYILNLIKVIANPKGRELSLRQVDLKRALEFGVTEVGRQRVYAYLGQ
jgi:hypothetical protein